MSVCRFQIVILFWRQVHPTETHLTHKIYFEIWSWWDAEAHDGTDDDEDNLEAGDDGDQDDKIQM